MNEIVLRPLESAAASELAALQNAAFADYAQSKQLAEVVASESAARSQAAPPQVQSPFGLAAFRGTVLVGWSQGYREGTTQFYMLNSGVAHAERRQGVYSQLVRSLLAHADLLATRASGHGTLPQTLQSSSPSCGSAFRCVALSTPRCMAR